MSQSGPEPVRVEIRFIGGCPNRRITVERISEVLKEMGVAAEIREVKVDPTWASVLGSLGSPSVYINGIDIEPSARTSNRGLMYRTYRDGEQIEGAPSKQLIRQALLNAGTTLRKTANQ
jgi:hypothetical protein